MTFWYLLAVVVIVCTVLFELKTYRFQRWGASLWEYAFHVVFLITLWLAAEEIAYNYRDNDLVFTIAHRTFMLVPCIVAVFIAGGLVSFVRLAFDAEVPENLQKSDEDKKREKKIREAKKEQEYRMMEEDVGLVAEEEPKYKNDDIDHEAELEEILKSRK